MNVTKKALVKEVKTLMEKAGSFSLGDQFIYKGQWVALEVKTNREKQEVIIKFLQVPSLKSIGPKLAKASVLLGNGELGLLQHCKRINKQGKVVFRGRGILEIPYTLAICR